MKKQIDVVGAVIVKDGAVLCVQRGPDGSLPGMWEFPGGKVEPGESPVEALRREIREELLCDVEVGEEVTTTAYEYGFGIVHLTTHYCELIDGIPVLTEHASQTWLPAAKLHELTWAPADIPAVQAVQARFR